MEHFRTHLHVLESQHILCSCLILFLILVKDHIFLQDQVDMGIDKGWEIKEQVEELYFCLARINFTLLAVNFQLVVEQLVETIM